MRVVHARHGNTNVSPEILRGGAFISTRATVGEVQLT